VSYGSKQELPDGSTMPGLKQKEKRKGTN